DSTLSFLPYAHVLGRVEMWLSIYSGFTLCLAQSIDRIKSNLMEVQPTAMIAVPRIFEKFFAAINSEVSQRKLLFSVLGVCRKISPEWT
ncbi:AMP-binding protein, partial [Shewanella algae]|uniref:AMP-binding protein n=1 Tax=Shewanella algae TaxID=38313 RepID=UPI00313EB31B